MTPKLADPATWGVTLKTAKLNGIQQRWADTGEAGRPVVLLMHGWPESWFSWRHQLKALSEAGYRGVAPDMRGYGGTSAPEHKASYNVYNLAADMLSLLQRLGASTAALVGHDHGANLGWKLALLHPDVFTCYMAMSVPYTGRGPAPPIAGMRTFYGDERKPETGPNFFYILHHQLANAASDYSQDTRASLMSMYSTAMAGGSKELPAITSPKLFVDGKSEPMWRRIPQAPLSPWISKEEFEYFVQEFERNGWDGGLNWYRAMDIDWHATPQLKGAKVQTPVGFIAGSRDVVIGMVGGKEATAKQLEKTCTQGVKPLLFIKGAGHWIQQEKPAEVNAALLEFLNMNRSRFATPELRSRL